MHLFQTKSIYSTTLGNQRKNLINLLLSQSKTTTQLKQIHAQLLFQTPPLQSSLYLCNSMLFSYANSSDPNGAFTFFATEMRLLAADHFSLQFLLKASSKTKLVIQITQIHLMIFKFGFGVYTSLMNSILHCYSLSGQLGEARKVFDEMSERDVVSFNSLIHGYAELGDMNSAFQLFQQVPSPSVVTWTAVVAGFSNNADVSAARRVFEEMPERDLVSWNAMISGYVKNRNPLEALSLFLRMQRESFKPNTVTIATILSACASLGALDTGKWIHVFINKNRIHLNPFLGSSLIDMYSKCGVIELALDVFRCLKENNTCTWNALINGLAMNGYAEQALDFFNKMLIDRSVRPDKVTFVGVLLACSHGGFIEEGRKHFYCTMKEYGVTPILEHYACIVDLLGSFQGCDGSILLNSTSKNKAEKDEIPNLSLAGFDVIEEIKAKLEKACPETVSCADVVALAARDSVAFQYKKDLWEVPTGRRDGRVSLASKVFDNLPSPFANFSDLLTNFKAKGLNVHDLVVLSGGHTIGIGHCNLFADRLYNFTGKFPKPDVDPSLNPSYVAFLKTKCKSSNDFTTPIDMDPKSSFSFDVNYFVILKKRMGLFLSDAALLTNKQASKIVNEMTNPEKFLTEFSQSMKRLGKIEVLTGKHGEIRKKCGIVN